MIFGSTCTGFTPTQIATCLDYNESGISHILVLSKSITAVNGANLIPQASAAAYTYIGAGASATTLMTTLAAGVTAGSIVKSPSVATEWQQPTTADVANYSDCNGNLKVVTGRTIKLTSTKTNKTNVIMTAGAMEDLAQTFWTTLACGSNANNILFVNCAGQLVYPVKLCGRTKGYTGLNAFADFSFNYYDTKDPATNILQHVLELTSRDAFILVPFVPLTGAAAALATAA